MMDIPTQLREICGHKQSIVGCLYCAAADEIIQLREAGHEAHGVLCMWKVPATEKPIQLLEAVLPIGPRHSAYSQSSGGAES